MAVFNVTISDPAHPNRKFEIKGKDDFLLISDHITRRESTFIPPEIAIFFPVRTNSMKYFLKDLFLPATIHAAITVQNVALKIFAILGTLLVDIISLPIRLLISIPRLFVEPKKEENGFYQYLKKKAINKRFIITDLNQVMVTREWPSKQRTEKDLVTFITWPLFDVKGLQHVHRYWP